MRRRITVTVRLVAMPLLLMLQQLLLLLLLRQWSVVVLRPTATNGLRSAVPFLQIAGDPVAGQFSVNDRRMSERATPDALLVLSADDRRVRIRTRPPVSVKTPSSPPPKRTCKTKRPRKSLNDPKYVYH